MGWRDLAFRLEGKLHNRLLKWGAPTVKQAEVPAETYISSIEAYCAQHDTAAETLQLDGRYVAPTTIPDDVGRVVDLLVYRPERFDCEDYALTFKVTASLLLGVNTIGVVIDWTGGHAYNIIMLADEAVVLYEPQEGRTVEPGSEERFAFERVEILL